MKNYITYLFLIFFLIINFNVTVASNDLLLKYNNNLKVSYSEKFNLKSEVLSLPEFNVRGIYVTGWTAGIPERMMVLTDLLENSSLNSMVINVKDELGTLSYKTDVELANKISANRNKIKNVKALIKSLHSKGIYIIGRIAVFKDALLAQKRPDLAQEYWLPKEDKISTSKQWVNPMYKEVWDYNIDIAREALNLGFDEIQFDYIRFPAMAHKTSEVILNSDYSKSQLINKFAATAQKELDYLSKPISIDVFGLTTAANDDLGIGQNFKELSNIIKIISPMVYPSHYASGSYGIDIPSKSPYKIIHDSMLDARKKTLGNHKIVIRPWLQDFSLKYKYSEKDVKAQIKALDDLGIKEWLLWNPRSQYTEQVFLNPSF